MQYGNEALREKLLETIETMSEKELAELLNFISAMDEERAGKEKVE